MTTDILPLNERAAQILLEQLSQPDGAVLCSDAVWPLRGRSALAFWQRYGAKTDFSVWDRHYAGALLGLPRARDELAMNLQLTAARLLPDAPLVLFGQKDAGIAAAERVLHDVFVQVTLALTKFHGRVFLARQPRAAALVDTLEGWRQAHHVAVPGKEVSLVSYPGMFADGKLDSATALLIMQLASQPAPAMVLDYACGAGILALACRQIWPKARLSLLDHDALAVRAAQVNVPEAETLQAENMSACSARYDLIVSNPPIHRGAIQDYGVIEQLVTQAPDYLSRNGQLLLVTQQTVPVQRWAKQATVLAQEGGFKVWKITNG